MVNTELVYPMYYTKCNTFEFDTVYELVNYAYNTNVQGNTTY